MKKISAIILIGGISLLNFYPGLAKIPGTITSSSMANEKRTTKDTIHVVGHAHMDMNWLWTYSETIVSLPIAKRR